MTHSATHRNLTSGSLASYAQTQTRVLTIGPWQQREFAAAVADIPAARAWPTVTNIRAACDLLTDSEQPPELIFLAQPPPGLYRQADIDHLQQLVPLARLVVVAGTWCEGELRTGTLPTGTIRLYWYELASWWQAALRRRSAGLCPLWSLPLDHPLAGRYSSEILKPTPTPSESAILIDTADFAVYETLAAALSAYGLNCYPSRGEPTSIVTAGIWDGGQLSKREVQRLTKFCRRVPGRVIALLDFPRVEHIQQAQAAGATALVAKPYVVEEVVMMLQQ